MDVRAGEDARLAAAALVDIVNQHASRGENYPSEQFKDLFEKCFLEAENHDELRFYHNQATRVAIKTGNIDLVRYLLSKDKTKSLLGDNPDNLQIALCVQDNLSFGSTDPTDMVKLVLEHGALVNGCDEERNTPLFYTSSLGLPDSFKLLIDHGADFTTRHKLPVEEKRGSRAKLPGDDHKTEVHTPLVDLMQVALHAMDCSTVLKNSVARAYECWAPTILFFIDAHFDTILTEDLFRDLMEAACDGGDIDAVNKFWVHQMNLDAAGCASDQVAVSLAPGLKSATREGHVDIVKLLLRCGADPRLICQDTRPAGRLGRHKEQPGRLGEANHNIFKTVIGAVCEEGPKDQLNPKPPAVLDACECLFWKGVSKADQLLLLTEASRQGRIDIVERLWTAGVRVDQAPITSSVVVLELFSAHNVCLDWATLQKYAIQVCQVDTLEWLVERAGPHLRSEEDFGKALEELSGPLPYYDKRSPVPDEVRVRQSIFEYLCTSYARPDRVTSGIHAQLNRLLLRSTKGCLRHLQAFLQAGVRSGCPAISQAAFVEMELKSHPDKTVPSWGLSDVEARIRALQLLSQCHACTLLLKTQGHEIEPSRLWLTPPTTSKPNQAEKHIPRRSTKLTGNRPKRKLEYNASEAVPFSELDLPLPEDEVASGLPDNTNHALKEGKSNTKNDGMEAQGVSGPPTDIGSSMETDEHIINDDENIFLADTMYQKLGSTYATRLLVLEPSEDSHAPITCTLISVNLAEKPEYEALSYVWGHERKAAGIQLNGRTRLVRKNLRAALTRLRFRNRSRVLWIDALCINQRDIDERNHQVSIMLTIYQSAKQVLIWVGESGDGSTLVFDYIRNLRKKHGENAYCDEPDSNGAIQAPWNFHYAKGRPTLKGELGQAFEKFCARPWFSRTWVIQEFTLSRHAIVVCGNDKEEWHLLREVYPGSPVEMVGSRLNQMDKIRNGIRGVFWGGKRSHRVNEIPIVESILQYSRTCQATEPRDKVYALLGILGYPSIKVDYRLPVEEVYTSFSQTVFEQAGRLAMLHEFGFERKFDNLPSWVLDLTVSPNFGKFSMHRGIPSRKNEAGKSIAYVMDGFRIQKSTMFIKGGRIDQIDEVGQVLPAPSIDGPPLIPDDIRNVMQSWESCASRIKNPNFSIPVPAAYLNTLMAYDHTLNKHHAPTKYDQYRLKWYESFGAGELEKVFPEYFHDVAVVMAWADHLYPGLGRETAWDGDRVIPHSMECCYGRRFFTTRNGTMGLCHSRTKPGDLVVFLSGGIYPFALREQGDGAFKIVGDCYLYDFDECDWDMERIRNFEEFRIK